MVAPNPFNNLTINSMNARNQNRLKMYLVVANNLNTVPSQTLTAMPHFVQLFADFKAGIAVIQKKSETQSASRLGFRIAKTAAKEEAVRYAVNMNDCLAALALATNDTILQQQMKYTKSMLSKERDISTLTETKFILSKAIELQNDLQPYGVDQTQIDKLALVIQNFSNKIPLPRNNINKNKIINKDIEAQFTDCKNLLTRMDGLVKILELTNPAFCTQYFFTRKIVNCHNRKLTVRGYASDTNGNPITSVTVKIPTINRETKTTDKGYFEFKNLPKGMQNIIFSRVDFQTTNRHIGVVSGQRLELNLTMEAALNTELVV